MTELRTRIKMRRDTSSNWTSTNPILLDGEIIIVDTDSGEVRLKIGDGQKTYKQLPFNDEALRALLPTDMTGASESSSGTHGLVPAPNATDKNYFLKGDGSWASPLKNVTWGAMKGI